MLTLIFWTIAIAVGFYYWVVKPYDYWKSRGVKQGKPHWVLGDQWDLMLAKESLPEMVIRLYNQYEDDRYFGIYEFLRPTLLIKDPDLIKQMTVKDFDHFTDHGSLVPEDSDPLWSKNLLALKGQKWREMRSTLSPSFTASKIKTMFTLVQESAQNFIQFLLEKEEDFSLEMKDTYTRVANDVIATTAFGIKVDSLRETDNEFYRMVKKTVNFKGFWTKAKIIAYLIFPRVLQALKIGMFSADIKKFFMDVVNETIKAREEQGIVRPDMIHLLMEAQKENEKEEDGTIDPGFATVEETELVKKRSPRTVTNEDIAAQALIFFFAGFDTVSTALCFTTHELAVNPEIQEKLRNEIVATLEECDGKLTYEALSKMKYMDMVVSESLRKWPSALTDRHCVKPYTIEPVLPGESPIVLRPGNGIWIPMFGLHRDPKYFPDPERFDPERFNEENKGKIKPFTYMPFGFGPRNCIGSRFALMEVKTVLFYVLLNFEFYPVEKTQVPLTTEVKPFNAAMENGFWLGLKRINSESSN